MNIFDFLTADEIDAAPEDDSFAFIYLVRIAKSRLQERLRDLYDIEQSGSFIWEARLGFVNLVIGLAKTYKIEPFASMAVPTYAAFSDDLEREFNNDLDHYLAQIVLGNALRTRRDSVLLPSGTKERLRTLISHIKSAIDKADVSDAKRTALHAKLRDFEAALDKERVNLLAVSRVVLEVMSLSANVAVLADSQAFNRLLTNVMTTVAHAKAVEDEARQVAPHDPPAQITAPRPSVPTSQPPRQVAREAFSADLDDEIPF